MTELKQTQLTQQEILRGKMLSPETTKLLSFEIDVLTNVLTGIVFSADPVERETAVLQYVEAQAKRNALMELVLGSSDTYTELATLESQDRN